MNQTIILCAVKNQVFEKDSEVDLFK